MLQTLPAGQQEIVEASPNTEVWIQLESVSATLEVAQACRPDALVSQGSDAGGHGHANILYEITTWAIYHLWLQVVSWMDGAERLHCPLGRRV